MLIHDPNTSTAMKVNGDGRALVDSPSPMEGVAEAGYAFAFDTGDISLDAGDTAILIKNTTTERNFHVDEIEFLMDSSPEIVIHCPTCASPTGSAITPTNLNRGSGVSAPATAVSDETTNVQANIVSRRKMDIGVVSFVGSLILGNGNCLAVDVVSSVLSAKIIVRGYFKNA